VLDLFTFDRVRSRVERREALQAVGASDVREVFERILPGPVAIGAAGKLPKAAGDRLHALAEA
jgi:hypothetical protein